MITFQWEFLAVKVFFKSSVLLCFLQTDAVSDNENQIPTLSLELHLNKTHSRKSSEQNAAKTNPVSVFATLKDSNKKLFFVNSVAKSTEISSDMTYEMSVFCNHGTPKESSSENIEYQGFTASNTEVGS